jgi:hypothetical protein
METLAREINSGEKLKTAIGIKLNPKTVEWCAQENMQCDEYDGIFYFENLFGVLENGEQWDGDCLADYLETLTREFVAENQE